MARAVLFVSCMVDLFRPSTAIAAVAVMERRGVEVSCPSQACCGQFAYNAGHWPEAFAMAGALLDALSTDRAADAVVGLAGSCVAMVRSEYPKLMEWAAGRPETRDAAARARQAHAEVVPRLSEFTQWANDQLFDGPPHTPPADLSVALHTGCHMRRLLHADASPPALLRRLGVQPVEPEDADQCCGFGGTYSMSEPEISTALADEKLERLRETGCGALVGSDWGCLLHLAGRLSRLGEERPVLHAAELMDLADRGRLDAQAVARAGRFLADAGRAPR
jgi:L-lactate dehydrogenase complex protein LldE